MRILSGIQPSGTLHLGNYFGMMKPAIELQEKGQAFYFLPKVADMHRQGIVIYKITAVIHFAALKADFFAALADVSAASTMDDFPHQEVEGLGDGAFFKAGLRSGDLVVLHGGGILIVEGETPAGEQLGQAEMQAVAEAALATLG